MYSEELRKWGAQTTKDLELMILEAINEATSGLRAKNAAQAELLERAVFEIGFNPECHCEPSTNHICNSCQLVREINAALGKGEE